MPAFLSTFKITETGGPTLLTLGTVADGQLLRRFGSTLVGVSVASLVGVTKASGAGTVDIVSVADPSIGGAAALIIGVAGGDEFFRIGDSNLYGTPRDTSFGFNAVATNSGVAIGFGPNGSNEGAALGTNANGSSNGAAFGAYSNGSTGGAAAGFSAVGSLYGAAVGNSCNGSSYGAAIGAFTDGHGLGNAAIGGSTGPGTAAIVPDTFTDTIQLGRGTATVNGGLHFRGFSVLSAAGILADGRFPATLPAASGVNLTKVTKASGLGAVDIVSVADPSVGGAALLIQGVAGGDVFFNIGDAGLTGFANETRFGIGTSTTVESEAFGFGAAAVSQAVAMGTSSYALNGVAIGWSSYTTYGTAVGYNSNALLGSTAIGQVASGDAYSVSIGPYTNSGDNGVAIGRFANAHGAGCVAIAGDPGATLPATVPFGYTDTIQLGRGTSTINGGLHFRGWAIVNASGILADGRFPATLPVASGVNLTALNASNLASGTVASGRGGAGTVSGLLKANGAGVVSAAVVNVDYADMTYPNLVLLGMI